MAQSSWIGLGALLLLIGFVVLAFRGGLGIRRDDNQRIEDDIERWPGISQGGTQSEGSGNTSSPSSD
jgi:hypothetical protein